MIMNIVPREIRLNTTSVSQNQGAGAPNPIVPAPNPTVSTPNLPGTAQSTAVPSANTSSAPPGNASSPVANSNGTAIAKGPAKTGISGGAVAGAAIGGLLVGAIIAAILVFFLLQKRQKKVMSRRHSRSSHRHHARTEKLPVVQTSAIGTIDEYLPQVIDDDAVKTEVSRISDNIKNHVRTHYYSNGVAFEQVDTSRLDFLGMATGVSSSTLIDALVDPSTRTYALRLFIAWSILARVGPESPSNLLPPVLSTLASTLAVDAGKNTASTTLFSKWKVITGVLLQQNQGKQGVSQQASAEALADLDRVLGPFVSASSDGVQRKRNLEWILNKAGNLSLLLFSQPGSYRFDFATPKGGLTVFPALLQTVDSGAEPLIPPKLIWEKEIMEIGEM